ncbi:MAG: hypothetical protein QOK37_947 [Thermoanaerobaculia bacterium]|jgi:DNA-binding transcriptional MocR family regulator|nr:hypothetical protein [Thermoanaerobaculia bacterium]
MSVQQYLKGSTAVKIAASAEAAVARGLIAGGSRLPAVRVLAAVLHVSPATAAAAYRILQERGIVISDGRRGTIIRLTSPAAPPAPAPLPPNVHDLASGNPSGALLPGLGPFLKKLPGEPRLYRDDLNDATLVTLAKKQFASDNVPAGSVAIVSGALDGIERVLREQLRPGDRVLVEDPCFTGVADLLNSLSLIAVPVALDDEGLLPAALQHAPVADALIVTPRAQNPTGAAFSERRAKALRTILRHRPDLLLIEDDHAGLVAGAPYITLVEKSRARWAVVRSMSKSLGPDLRVAIMAGDAQTIARVEGRQALGIRWVSHILQGLVAKLLVDARVRKLLARAERTYARRRRAVIEALKSHAIDARGASGLNVWIPLQEESAIVQALFRRRWAVTAGERYRIQSAPGVRVTIASLEPEDAVRFAADLADVLRPARRSAAGA